MKAGDYKTKRAAIEAGLQLLIQRYCQKRLRELRGMIHWEGDLDEMRHDSPSAFAFHTNLPFPPSLL